MFRKISPFFSFHAATAFVVGAGIVGIWFYGIHMGAELRLEINEGFVFESKPKGCID
ncbi:MAG: hypothetical protein AAF572_17140 [Cyanobacteria bacterium P01_B01_bin.77]